MQLLSSFPWMRRFALQLAFISVALVIMVSLAACGGGSTKAARNCFEIWNGSSNKVQQAKVAHPAVQPAADIPFKVVDLVAQTEVNVFVDAWARHDTP